MRLYVHIPFCRSKCTYCAFFSQQLIPESKQIFLAGLEQEIRRRGDEYGDRRVKSVYFGGGTPSVLPLQDLEQIIGWIDKEFSLDKGLEFTLEGNPESLGRRDYIRGLTGLGVNRVSIGLQSLAPEQLHVLGRAHTARQGLETLRLVREAGLENTGVDLIWGLPGQSPAQWLETLKTVVRHGPKHISCYGLTLEPGTVLARQEEEGGLEFPGEDEQARMYIYGAEYLEGAGLLQYEISNFARMGFACGHNLGYWQGEDFLGLGPSSVSTLDGQRWQNPANVKDYAHAAEYGSAREGREFISPDKALKEMVMLSLRTTRGLSLREYRLASGRDFCAVYRNLIQALHDNNLIRISGGYVRLTKNGMLVSDAIISRILNNRV
ncbi:MAG: radical SAM family heme chaperone HemW [Desulfonatronovibrionaceae bacterium]